MMLPRVMPCLLLRNTQLVKTINFKKPSYVGDPVNAVKIYNEKEVDELIVLDITASKENRGPSLKVINNLVSECFMPLAYGGGITNLEEMHAIFAAGVEKVAINSYAVENPDFIKEASKVFGSQSIIVSVDVKKNFWGKYELYDHCKGSYHKMDPLTFVKLMEEKGAGELLVNSVDQEGTMNGYDLGILKKITSAVTIPVIACGGAGELADFGKAIHDGGASAVAAGSMVVYQGKNRAVLINFPKREELKPYLIKR
jgi:cyclase